MDKIEEIAVYFEYNGLIRQTKYVNEQKAIEILKYLKKKKIRILGINKRIITNSFIDSYNLIKYGYY